MLEVERTAGTAPRRSCGAAGPDPALIEFGCVVTSACPRLSGDGRTRTRLRRTAMAAATAGYLGGGLLPLPESRGRGTVLELTCEPDELESDGGGGGGRQGGLFVGVALPLPGSGG